MPKEQNIKKMMDSRRDLYGVIEKITLLLSVSFLGIVLFLILVALSHVPQFTIFAYICMAIYFYFIYPLFFYKETYVLIGVWFIIFVGIFF